MSIKECKNFWKGIEKSSFTKINPKASGMSCHKCKQRKTCLERKRLMRGLEYTDCQIPYAKGDRSKGV